MAVLTREERKEVASPWVGAERPKKLTSTDIMDAVQDIEDWIEANQVSFVAALPEPFKSATNAPAKTRLFVYVAMKRAGLL